MHIFAERIKVVCVRAPSVAQSPPGRIGLDDFGYNNPHPSKRVVARFSLPLFTYSQRCHLWKKFCCTRPFGVPFTYNVIDQCDLVRKWGNTAATFVMRNTPH
ncbi:hypothetical protein Y032_0728g1887 [Ancylostoma ceylanicum]|nr:hypothetical protein Y032_0728g1887 [Ancylostoma ceylanicum]